MSAAAAVTTATFDSEVKQAGVPVLVDFWAPWCGPCRMIAPHLDAIAQEYDGKAKIVKVDIDDSPELAEEYNVFSIPTLAFFKNGAEVDRIVGAANKNAIATKLEDVISK